LVFQRDVCRSRTVILGALEEEVVMLREELINKQVRTIERLEFVTGQLRGRDVAIAWTGVGKVNAAMVTTLAIEHFRPEAVIFTGIAGGLDTELLPGDIVIGERVAHHDLGILTDESISRQGGNNPVDGTRNPVFFEADRRLFESAMRAGEKAELKLIRVLKETRRPKVVSGIIITGDIFVASAEKSSQLRQELGADAIEMEGAAVAQVCYQQKIPWVVIRSISDRADEKAAEDAVNFLEIAAGNSASLVMEMIEEK